MWATDGMKRRARVLAAVALLAAAVLALGAVPAGATTTAYPEPSPCAEDFTPVADATVNTDVLLGSCDTFESQSPGAPGVHVYNWNHVSIPAGVTVTFTGSRVAEIRSPNAVQVSGTIVVSANGSTPGPGGGTGGAGGADVVIGGGSTTGTAGSPSPTGGGGGQPGTNSTAGAGGTAGANGGQAGANAILTGSGGGGGGAGSSASAMPLVGGSGGGGGGGSTHGAGGAGGGGGGAISIFSDASIDVGASGLIAANGVGGITSVQSGGGGGGASGGSVVLIAPQVSLENGGVLHATGGAGAFESPVWGAGSGGSGATGLVRVESLSFGNSGASNPTVTSVSFAAASLDVSTTGTGSGSVTSSPAGINCPGDCHELYNNGEQVTLTATPVNSGSVFAGWSGGTCAGSNPVCTFDATGGQAVTADFEPVASPETFIDSGPSGTTHDPTPTFTFHSDDSGATFQCKVDSGSFASCNSPKTLAHLGDGSHTFTVKAHNAAGFDSTPASRPFTVKTASVSVSGSTLVVTAAPGAKDNLKVTKPSASTIRVTDFASGAYSGSGVHVGSGCTRVGDYTANCMGSGINLVSVSSGDQIDSIVNSTSLASSLNGGPAADVLIGGSGHDTITGGLGADVMKGMNGNDRLLGHDGIDDTVNCDGGTAPGGADSADLDALPKDSPATGCESVTRH